jgi:hypothetical protein
VVQLDVPGEDYVLLNLEQLTAVEREMARRVLSLDQRPRAPHEIEGDVREVPRPWQRAGPAPEPITPAPEPVGEHTPTQDVEEADSVVDAGKEPAQALAGAVDAPRSSMTETLARDAEALRLKGLAAAQSDPALARKYLLASTVLENNSVDVWLTLVDLAPSERQKTSFRREAEKVLRRQRGEM